MLTHSVPSNSGNDGELGVLGGLAVGSRVVLADELSGTVESILRDLSEEETLSPKRLLG